MNQANLINRRIIRQKHKLVECKYLWDTSTKIGSQADSSVIATYGNTVIHGAVTSQFYSEENGLLYSPASLLEVEYRDRHHAHNRIPQSKSRRERSHSDGEILSARCIDRALRPLFMKSSRTSSQLVITTHAIDGIQDPLTIAINTSSALMLQSTSPWGFNCNNSFTHLKWNNWEKSNFNKTNNNRRTDNCSSTYSTAVNNNYQDDKLDSIDGFRGVGAVKVGYIDEKIVIDPTIEELGRSQLNLLFVGTDVGCVMLDIAANEVPNLVLSRALIEAHNVCKVRINEQIQSIIDHRNTIYTNAETDESTIGKIQNAAAPSSNDVTRQQSIISLAVKIGEEESKKLFRGYVPFAKVTDLKQLDNYLDGVLEENCFAILPKKNEKKEEGLKQSNSISLSLSYLERFIQLFQKKKSSLERDNTCTKNMNLVRFDSKSKRMRALAQTRFNDTLRKSLKLACKELLDANCKNPTNSEVEDAVNHVLSIGFRQSLFSNYQLGTGLGEEFTGNIRMDGRSANEIRDINVERGTIKGMSGSASFSRGETNILASCTLASLAECQEITPVNGSPDILQSFLLQYDFPRYSTGRIGNTTLDRRMVGHGALAHKALLPVIPSIKSFPYYIRVLAECTASSGSSSMATTTAACLAMLDSGVPIGKLVAGISIGLVHRVNDASSSTSNHSYDFILLTDIIGSEDYFGSMDLKVAGTLDGVTAAQMDVKISSGLPINVISEAFDKAEVGRKRIIEKSFNSLIDSPKDQIKILKQSSNRHTNNIPRFKGKSGSPYAMLLNYDREKRPIITGSGGEMKRLIEQYHGIQMDLSRETEVYFFGRNKSDVKAAYKLVNDMITEVKTGSIHCGKILKVNEFNCIVQLTKSQEGILSKFDITNDEELLKKPIDEFMRPGMTIDFQVLNKGKNNPNNNNIHENIIKVSRKIILDEKGVTGRDNSLLSLYHDIGPRSSSHEDSDTNNLNESKHITTIASSWDRDINYSKNQHRKPRRSRSGKIRSKISNDKVNTRK